MWRIVILTILVGVGMTGGAGRAGQCAGYTAHNFRVGRRAGGGGAGYGGHLARGHA